MQSVGLQASLFSNLINLRLYNVNNIGPLMK